MAQSNKEWDETCEQCIRELKIDCRLNCLPLQHPKKHIATAEDAMQINLMPQLRPSSGYENTVTAMDVFLPTYHLTRTLKQLAGHH